jgi:hypothetical protein
MRKLIPCKKCDMKVPMTRLVCEEALVSSLDNKLHAIQRTFEGECPLHSKFWYTTEGHHRTVWKKQRKLKERLRRKRRVAGSKPATAPGAAEEG